MSDKYEYHRGFFQLVIDATDNMEEIARGDKRLELIAYTSVYKSVFSGLYETLVRNKEMDGLEQQPIEYKQELWIEANKYLPGEPEAWKIKYCKAIMGFLWLMNN